MSTSTLGLGVPVPKMLPITGTFMFPFLAYSAFLATSVVRDRFASTTYLGDGANSNSPGSTDTDKLRLDSRAFSNFTEYVPSALLLAAVAELNGANRKVLSYSLIALFAVRVAHAEFGIKRGDNACGWGRPVGFIGTQTFLVSMAAYATYLVKGYWGY